MAADASAQLHEIALRLKAASTGRELKLELARGIRASAQPLVWAVEASALEQLPHSGGLNRQVASQRVSVSVRTGARTAGVRLLTTAPDTAMTDAGFVRHPTFGRRGKGEWRTQQIPHAVGWWSKTLQRRSPRVTPAVIRVMESVSAKIQGV